MNVKCKNCSADVTGKYCNNCGQVKNLKRIDKKYAVEEFLDIVGYKKGFLHTIKAIAIKPSSTVKTYLYQNRDSLTKPISFIVLTSVIYTFIYSGLAPFSNHLQDTETANSMLGKSALAAIYNWSQTHYAYANLLMILPIAFWTQFIFRKQPYNFFEIFVLITYIIGFTTLIFCLDPILELLFPKHTLFVLNTLVIVSFVYVIRAIVNFYQTNTKKSYFKAILAHVLGVVSFFAVVIGLALIYDMIF